MKIFKIAFAIFTGVAGVGAAPAAEPIPVHCEKDTAEVRELVTTLAALPTTGERVLAAAESFVGSGHDDYLNTDSTATLRINVDTFTPLAFINASMAAAKAAEVSGGGWRAYAEALRNLACRRGEDNGFPSLFYHSSDWIGDNIYRGNFVELTDRYAGARSMTTSLDYLSTHREEFPALANPDTYDKVRMTEMGFRSHKLPYLPRQVAGDKDFIADLKNGDVIVMITNKERTDTYDIGIVKMEEDGPHLIHFDRKTGLIAEEEENLKRYFNLMAKYFGGFRWIRLE